MPRGNRVAWRPAAAHVLGGFGAILTGCYPLTVFINLIVAHSVSRSNYQRNSKPYTDVMIITDAITEIPGLCYLSEYISAQEEGKLAAAIDAAPWDTTWRRRRQPYGASYGKAGTIQRSIPDWAKFLVNRFQAEKISERPFDQMLINEYLPGQGIALHRDYESFDRTVVSLSLLAPCVMDFRHADDSRKGTVVLEPRSLLILSDEARYEWQHGIAARKSDRWQGKVIPRARRLSVTFRLLKSQ
jgi:alkylated DNA repair dioxygenase AlkB